MKCRDCGWAVEHGNVKSNRQAMSAHKKSCPARRAAALRAILGEPHGPPGWRGSGINTGANTGANISQAEPQAGLQAGLQAGSQAGLQAGSQADSQVGLTAFEKRYMDNLVRQHDAGQVDDDDFRIKMYVLQARSNRRQYDKVLWELIRVAVWEADHWRKCK